MFKIPEGFKDLLPESAEVFYFVQQKLYQSFLSFGYRPVLTSSVEFLKTYIVSGEEEGHIFNFIDHYANKPACFRFDFTPQIVRIISSNINMLENLPVRICYFGPVLRNPDSLYGKPREIHHAGIELIGVEDIKAELEIVFLINEIIRNLNINREIKIFFNDNEILKKLLNKTGLYKNTELKQAFIYRDISRIEKIISSINLDGLVKKFIIELPLLCGDKTLLKSIIKKYQISYIAENINQLIELCEFTESIMGKKIYIDLGEVRGLEYHSGIVFDGYLEDNQGNMREIITGGRYNKLLKQFGINNKSATGFALDIIALSDCITPYRAINVALIADDVNLKNALEVAQFLRNKDIKVTFFNSSAKEKDLKNRFDYILVFKDNIKLTIKNCKREETKILSIDDFFKASLNDIFDLERKE
ncbi:MAG: ATP phosphoribosyltransferase regulatory subunit [Proteobacteria bacterium]|nr:ATP phosphoribosyltransferase regulatory subunit [Pseudomonadota bacterium]